MSGALTRREILSAAAILSNCRRNEAARQGSVATGEEPTAAVSLTALGATQPTLPGMNRISGFLLNGGEVVAFGRHDANIPAIDKDILAVALRNSYSVSPEYEGVPGCTIDPIPRSDGDPFRIEKAVVFGLCRSSILAALFVRLDYEAKRAGAGVQEPGGKVLPSSFELENRGDPCALGAGERAAEIAHRFWFSVRPGRQPRFQRSDDKKTVSVIHPTGCRLLTEQEFLNRRGERTGATDAKPAALAFAAAVTKLLDEEKIPRYAQMTAAFRLIELGALMRFTGVRPECLSYLLYDHKLAIVDVPEYVGGITREEAARTVCDSKITKTETRTGSRIESLETVSTTRYTYRGGVEARVEIVDDDVRQGPLDGLRRRVLEARPASDAVSWRIPREG